MNENAEDESIKIRTLEEKITAIMDSNSTNDIKLQRLRFLSEDSHNSFGFIANAASIPISIVSLIISIVSISLNRNMVIYQVILQIVLTAVFAAYGTYIIRTLSKINNDNVALREAMDKVICSENERVLSDK